MKQGIFKNNSLIKTNDGFGHSSVHIKTLPSSRWVYSDDGMNAFNMLRSSVWVSSIKIFVSTDIDGFPPVDNFAEFWTELGISCIATGPQRITTNCGHSIVV